MNTASNTTSTGPRPPQELTRSSLVLGGNVFGGTCDEAGSFEILDAYLDAGGDHIDLADVYPNWVPGCEGGESEQIVGRWHTSRRNRDRVIIGTKVSLHPDAKGLSPTSIRRGIEASLRRLQTDHIDLYYAHFDDRDVPLEETLGTFAELVEEGKVRHLAASNYKAERLAAALEVSDREGFPRFRAFQAPYNLMRRDRFEGDLADLVAREGLAFYPYFSLASGFLTGKYRGVDVVDGPRARLMKDHFEDADRAVRVLTAVEEIAEAHGASMATVALAWLAAQPTVTAPMASASNLDQLPALLDVASVQLTDDEVARLTAASAV